MAGIHNSQFALKYYRHHRREWDAFESVDDAVASAFWMLEDGHGAPEEVVSLAGEVLLQGTELEAAMARYGRDRPRSAPLSPPTPVAGEDADAASLLAQFLGVSFISDSEWQDVPDFAREAWRAKAWS